MAELPAAICIASSCGELTAFSHGGQVVGWRPRGEDHGVLWLSPRVVLDSTVAIRGGVPVCFPWFGPGVSGDMTPAHGFARMSEWTIDEVTESDEQLHLRMSLDSVTSELFPYDYHIALGAQAADDLRICLDVTNRDARPFTIEEALHAYLHVGDIERIRILGLDGATFVDKTRDGQVAEQSGDLVLTAETDRAYVSTSSVDVVDPVLRRTLRVDKEGSASTIVWNPWATKAAAMSDIGEESWKTFVCVEAGNVLDRAITIDPGETHRLTYRLSVLR